MMPLKHETALNTLIWIKITPETGILTIFPSAPLQKIPKSQNIVFISQRSRKNPAHSKRDTMNISRNFLLIGAIYLLIGLILGMYMGAKGDYSLSLLHAHANLLGFALTAIFALVYKLFPMMSDSGMGRLHFWLHSIGTLGVIVMIFLLESERIDHAQMAPVAPISELFVVLGAAVFGWNIFKNAN